jgi:hypothetical protein
LLEVKEKMKFEKTETLRPHHHGRCYTCFIYVNQGHRHGDSIYVGSECGKVSAYHLMANSHHITNSKEEDLSKETPQCWHKASINCLLHSNNSRLTSNSPGLGILFSGSKDGYVKAWDSDGYMIQSLPHSSSVTALSDGYDGSMLTICGDGYLRMWSPQAGREMMLHPFFECTHSVNVVNPQEGWLSAISINPYGQWSCFLGESDGSVSVYRKPLRDLNASVEENAISQSSVKRHARWVGVHTLSVTNIKSIADQGWVITLSADCTCKILDQFLGQPLYTMENKSKCVFTGISFMNISSYLLLVDELGTMHKYDFTKERLIDSLPLVTPNRIRKDKILSLHQNPFLGNMERFRNDDLFLVFMKPPPKRGLGELDPPQMGHKYDAYLEGGEVALWKPLDVEGECKEFIGHNGSVVGLGVYTLNNSFVTNAQNNLVTEKVAAVAESNSDGVEDETAGGASAFIKSLKLSAKDDERPSTNTSTNTNANTYTNAGKKISKKIKLEGNEHIFQVSKEEMALFSVGHDKIIKCWDEFDGKVTYEFKTKSRADVICMCMLWAMNSIATGHENGMVSLWNADAGTNVSSTVLKGSITSIVEAHNSRAHVIVGSDFSGMICVWNLTLFRINPIELPVETLMKSKHDPEDPGVLSLAFHKKSSTFFSGGNDTNIAMWRLDSANYKYVDNFHTEAVNSLVCSANFLLSGDEKGEVILWCIEDGDEATIAHPNPLPVVNKMIKWNALNPEVFCSAIISMQAVADNKLFILQSNDGTDRVSVLWKVWIEDCTPTNVVLIEASDEGAKDSEDADVSKDKPLSVDTQTKQLPAQRNSSQKEDKVSPDSVPINSDEVKLLNEKIIVDTTMKKLVDELPSEYTIYSNLYSNSRIRVQDVREFRHSHDISSTDILCQNQSVDSVYFGTSDGPIVKYPCNLT